ncbi:sarcosine oxidase subunit gamma [Gymnodinialimonas ulvae]|uniref:sarcosine oxidase subunit gamma n=1 Tax=Gymnodinialimonas ulvae TaxID=3126504 RepID=UPI0030A85FB5
MSNAISALPGVIADGDVRVTEMGLVGMITLKADLSAAATKKAVKSATGLDLPDARKMSGGDLAKSVAWMAPDELLILCPHGEAEAMVGRLTKELGKAHHLAVNVSDARAVFALTGAAGAVRDTLAKLTPADMAALPTAEMRRTRLAQVAGAICLPEEGRADVICFRSVAGYMFDLLRSAAKPGAEVGFH